MFTHIMVGADNILASRQFYDKTFAALGVPPGVDDGRGRIWWMAATGMFGLTLPINGKPASGANGGTIGLVASSPEQVDAWHAAGVASGGSTCEDPPGLRNAGPTIKLYVAYLRDPAGNKLTAVHQMPA
ncbi:VOC family protein [Pseudomonas fluorescens]|nr:VOC family protein [Pseudomonas fluorescens]